MGGGCLHGGEKRGAAEKAGEEAGEGEEREVGNGRG